MADFKYVGPKEGTVGGYCVLFPPGKATRVNGQHLIDKARRNPDFEEVTAPAKPKKTKTKKSEKKE